MTGNAWAQQKSDVVIVFYFSSLTLKIILTLFFLESLAVIAVFRLTFGLSDTSHLRNPDYFVVQPLSFTLETNFIPTGLYFIALYLSAFDRNNTFRSLTRN